MCSCWLAASAPTAVPPGGSVRPGPVGVPVSANALTTFPPSVPSCEKPRTYRIAIRVATSSPSNGSAPAFTKLFDLVVQPRRSFDAQVRQYLRKLLELGVLDTLHECF